MAIKNTKATIIKPIISARNIFLLDVITGAIIISGIPEDDVRKAINGGIRKVNVGTHIRYTYVKSVGEAIQEKGPATHTADIMEVAKKNVKEVLYDWMRICSNK